MAISYEDDTVVLDDAGITIRAYYFPFGGEKRIPYGNIRGVSEKPLTLLNGKWRIWGSQGLRTWFSLDVRRPTKKRAFILDVGKTIRPVLTPDDAVRVAEVLRERVRS